MGQIVLLGIDAGTWKVMDPLIKAGKLPNFSKLKEKGAWGFINPLEGYKSPALWTSVVTGKVPQKHGIEFFCNTYIGNVNISSNVFVSLYDRFFSLFYKDSYHAMKPPKKLRHFICTKIGKTLEKLKIGGNFLLTCYDRKTKALWNIISENRKKVGVVGWWASWPAEPVNGFFLSEKCNDFLVNILNTGAHYSMSSGREKLTYPYTLANELEQFHKNSISTQELKNFFPVGLLSSEELDILTKRTYVTNNHLSTFRHNFLADQFYFDAGMLLWQREKPDLFLLYLAGLDSIQHLFWKFSFPEEFPYLKIKDTKKFGNVILEYYSMLDGKLGIILSELKEDDTIIVLSDHGMEAVPEQMYNPKKIRSGQHDDSPPGIFIAYGRGIKEGVNLGLVDVLDITPTILYLMELPIAGDMDGTVLKELLEEEGDIMVIESFGDKKKSSKISAKEDALIKKRLEDLGYL